MGRASSRLRASTTTAPTAASATTGKQPAQRQTPGRELETAMSGQSRGQCETRMGQKQRQTDCCRHAAGTARPGRPVLRSPAAAPSTSMPVSGRRAWISVTAPAASVSRTVMKLAKSPGRAPIRARSTICDAAEAQRPRCCCSTCRRLSRVSVIGIHQRRRAIRASSSAAGARRGPRTATGYGASEAALPLRRPGRRPPQAGTHGAVLGSSLRIAPRLRPETVRGRACPAAPASPAAGRSTMLGGRGCPP